MSARRALRPGTGMPRWPSMVVVAVLAGWSAGTLAQEAAQPAAAAPAAKAATRARTVPATKPGAAKKAPALKSAAANQPLDLNAPPIKHVLTPEQVQSFLAEADENAPPPEDVTVDQPHYAEPVPAGAFAALPWALLHPLEAWRIFAPITD